MLKKSLKTLSISLCIWLLSISIYWCDNAPGEEPTHNSAAITNKTIENTITGDIQTTEEKVEQKSIPSFESAIESIKEQSIWKLENSIKEELNKLKDKQVKSEGEWKISVSYWDTNGEISMNFSGYADGNRENILGWFKFALWVNNADILDEDFPKKLKVEAAYTALLQKAKQYFILNNINIDDLKERFTQEEDETEWEAISEIIKTVKWKWIEFNKDTICNEDSQEYSEAWCQISQNANSYIEMLSWANKEELESRSKEIIKIANDMLNSMKTSFFSTEVLTNPQLVEYEGNQAYKFSINKEKLKKDIKWIVKTYAEYYADQMVKKMQNYYSAYDDEYWMTEEDIKEMKQEVSEGVDEMFNEIYKNVSMKNFVAYLVYDEKTDTFDLVIEKIEIVIHRENETCDYSNMYNEFDEYVWPQCTTEDKYTTLSIAYSSKKHLFIIVGSEGKKALFKTTIGYNINWDTFQTKISYSWIIDDEQFIEDLITLETWIWKKESGNTTNNKMSFSIKIKKELFDTENSINITFNASWKSVFWEKVTLPNISSSIPFYKLEQFIENITKKYEWPIDRDYLRRSDLSQLWSAILSYYNNKWMFPETHSNYMVSVKKIEKDLMDVVELKQVPKDPDENSSFYFDWTTFRGEYGYKLMTKNTISKWWFVLMAKAETENTANFLAGIKLDDDLSKIKICTHFIKWNEISTEIPSDWTCKYKNSDDLRYIYVF